jgi:signal transduction histidine kinase
MKQLKSDLGAATAEYVVATMAAVGFAGLLLVILKSDQIKQVLFDLVSNALTVPGAGQ